MGFSLFAVAASPANVLPSAKDINDLAGKAPLITDTFVRDSFELRMAYEYTDRFTNPNDKNKLHNLAKKAAEHLQTTAKKQQKLKTQIEDYQGNDWDDKYGSTGLWRKLSADLYTTSLNKCQIDYYRALAAEQPQKNEILYKILVEIDSPNHVPGFRELLKGKTFALLAQTEPTYKAQAIKQFDMFRFNSDIQLPTRAEIEKIKLIGSAKPHQLDTLVETLQQNRSRFHFELNLSLAFLQQRLNSPEAFEKTVNLFPETKGLLGKLILSDLSARFVQDKLDEPALSQISVFEAKLAALTAWRSDTDDYKTLLEHLLSKENFQTPLILYVTAVKFADSSPAKAIDLLIKASKLQKANSSDKLQIPAEEIAAQAVQLAYNLFIENRRHSASALSAFENYTAIAAAKIDPELEYLYTIVLNSCGQTENAENLLQKIADRPAGSYRNKAKLDLFIQQNQLKDKDSARKFLDILDKIEFADDPNLTILKSKALRHLGKLNNSANCLLKVIAPDRCYIAGETMELLTQAVDNIEQFQKDDSSFIANCKTLAQFCCDCLSAPAKQTAQFLLIEISLLVPTKTNTELLTFEKLLNDIADDGTSENINFVRCRARLLTAQHKFPEAAELWNKICATRKNEFPAETNRNWKWWRAKFYELHCRAKSTSASKNNILHTIDVLENSFADIPPLWAEKLNSLKEKIK